ncbi:MAG TPA: hypothetical protein VE999_03360 [Gemmataceae bacterium]|nr:hypothetical protein [Gemmataceae bacterium]
MNKLLFPTDRWTRFLLAPALVFIATLADRNYQTDLWHHLARGRAIVTEGRLLDEDRFTYTVNGQPLQDVNWGWQVLFYRLYTVGGLSLVQTVNSAILAVMTAVLVVLAWRRSGSLIAAGTAGIFAFFGLWQLLVIRPQTLSLLLFVLLYGFLEEAGRRRWLLLVPPLIMMVWVNVHGGFPIGLVLIGGYVAAHAIEQWLAGPQRKQGELSSWLLCLPCSVAATLVNPYGWRVYEYVARTSKAASGRHIDEWLPPSLDLLTGKIWALSLLLLLIGFAFSRRRPTVREICVLCCFLPLACGSVRMVAWWLLICTPILAAQLTDLWPRLRQYDLSDDQPSFGNVLACGVLVFVMVLSLPWLEAFNPVLSRPERSHRTETDLQALADRLRAEGREGRIFTRFAWGEYMAWSLSPHFTVFMDGRIEIIPDEVWQQDGAVTRGRADWQEILDTYDVDYLVLDASGYHHDLLPLVESSCVWRQVCRCGDAVLFVRDRGSSPRSTVKLNRQDAKENKKEERAKEL